MNKVKWLFWMPMLSGLLFTCSLKPSEEPFPEPEPVELIATQQEIVDDINQYAHPIAEASPLSDPVELSVLDRLGQVKVVGLGEATHGTKEFFRMKDRIFRYLVDKHGFTVFAFEMDFAEAMIFNDYVLTGQGNIEQLMRDKMIFWTWRTEEVKALLLWMKEYNQSQADEAKLQFWGYDTQFSTYNVPVLQNKLKEIDEDLYLQSMLFLRDFQQLAPDYYSNQNENFRNGIKKDVDSLYNLVENAQDQIAQQTSDENYQIILRLARNIVQTEAVRWSYELDNAPNLRDQYMAENHMWLLEYLGADTKIASWAHNGHVANNINYGIGGGMGFHLRNELGRNYQIVGFSFSKGQFTAYNNVRLGNNVITKNPLPNSLNFFFHHADPENFILDLTSIPGGTRLNNLINTPTKFLSIGSVFNGNANNYYYDLRLKEQYDVIIHFDETNHTDLL